MLVEAVVDDRIVPAALVTGGASGIGKAVCEVLKRNGYLVAVADSDELGARAVADACGGFAFAIDVAEQNSVAAVIARSFDALGGRLDALVTATAAAFDESDDASVFARMHAVHVVGTYLCIREAAKRMSLGARICTVAAAGNGGSGVVVETTRAAVMALTREAARTLAPVGIAVNGVALGAARVAPSASIERAAPKDAAEAVAWLLSPQAKLVNGEVVPLDSWSS